MGVNSGVPEIETAFEIDADGIMKVSAAEKASGKSEKITITNCNDKGRLSQEEIDRMVKNAKDFPVVDKEAQGMIDARNHWERARFQEAIELTAINQTGCGS
uniref:Uncharacterized protein n=1 Tax=Opuntia streptacantha TaxID=393608 RepID=A0A7C9CXM0_OPUST